jgi:apolipoprotein N-acyltransferase
MNPDSPSRSSRAWLWLFLGAVLLGFTSFQNTVPLAAWLAPVFLLRFVRARPIRIALPVLAGVCYLATVYSLRGVFPGASLLLFGLAGVTGVIPYGIDRLLRPPNHPLVRTLVFPAAATVLDWGFGKSSLGTLGSPAYSQFGLLSLTQLVSITGVSGLVFLINWLAPVANEIWEQGFNSRTNRLALVFCTVLGSVLSYGSFRVNGYTWAKARPARVRIAALAVDAEPWRAAIPSLKQLASASDSTRAQVGTKFAPIIEELLTRTERQARAGARLVAWSEGAAPVLKEDETAFLNQAQSLARKEGIFLQVSLLSVLHSDHSPFAENRAVLIAPSGEIQWDYSKTVPALGEVAQLAPGPGKIPVAETPVGRLSTVICFDADFPGLVQQAGRAAADILLVPANDWSPIHIMHARAATFRAVENGVSLVRPTGNGLTVAVDPVGQLLAVGDSFAVERLSVVVDVPRQGIRTLYSRFGDVIPWLCVSGLTVLAVTGGRRSSRQS